MLVTLLVVWVVVVPLITVIGTFVLSGLLGRQTHHGAARVTRVDVLAPRRRLRHLSRFAHR